MLGYGVPLKTRYNPSGDQEDTSAVKLRLLIFVMTLPSVFATKIAVAPSRVDVKAINSSLGDQAGR